MRTLSAVSLTLALVLAACGGGVKKAPAGPSPDDVPQELTCCITVGADGAQAHEEVPVARCPEENRNPVDACDIGPGDAEPEY